MLLVPSTKNFIKALRADLEPQLAKFRPEVTVRPVLDQKALAEVAAEIESVKGLDKGKVRLGVTLDKSSLASSVAEIETLQKAIGAKSVKIRINTDDVDSARKKTTSLDKELSGLSSQATKGILLRVGLVGLPAAIAGIASLNTSIVELSRSALLLPGIVAGAVSVLGTLAVGASGVKDAISAASKAQDTAAQSAEKLANANRSVSDAQRDLNRAYKDAKRNLEDLYDQMRDAPLDEAEARLRLDEARTEEATKFGKTQLQQQKDTVARLRAQNELTDAQQRGTRVSEDFADAQSKGITNSDGVVTATERLQKSIETLNATVAKGSLSDEMAKLAPAGQAFVTQIEAMRTQWTAFKQDVQQHLFAGLDVEVTKLGSLLPNVKSGFDRIADSLNNNVKTAIGGLTSQGSKGLLDQIFGNTADAQRVLSTAIDPLIHSLLTLSATGSNALPKLAQGFGDLVGRFDTFISKAAKDGSLDKWINDGIKAVGDLGTTFLNIGKIMSDFSDIFTSAGGKGLLELLKTGTDEIHSFLTSADGNTQVKQFFQDVLTETRNWAPILHDVPGLIANVVKAAVAIGNVVLPILHVFTSLLSQDSPIIQGIVTAFLAWSAIHPIITATTGFLENFRTKLKGASGAVGEEGAKGGLRGAVGSLAGFLKSAGWTLAIAGAIEGISKLSEAHDRATEASRKQQAQLEGLKGTLDQVTGSATPDTIAQTSKAFQNYTLPSGKQVNLNSDASGLGINPSDAVSAAADPTQQVKKDQELGKLDKLTQDKISASDEYKRSKPFWDAAGIDITTLAKATNGDPSSVKRVQDAVKSPVDNLPFGLSDAYKGLVGIIDSALPASATPGAAPSLQTFADIAGASSSLAIGTRDTSKGLGDASRANANSSNVASGAPKGWQLSPGGPFSGFAPDGSPTRDASGQGFITLNSKPPQSVIDQWAQNGWTVSTGANGRTQVTVPPGAADQFLKPIPGFASGGMLSGAGSGTSDSNLAKVSNGEFISQAASVNKYGPDFYHALNSGAVDPGMLPGFAGGGLATDIPLPVPAPTPVPANPFTPGSPTYPTGPSTNLGPLLVPGPGDVTPKPPALPFPNPLPAGSGLQGSPKAPFTDSTGAPLPVHVGGGKAPGLGPIIPSPGGGGIVPGSAPTLGRDAPITLPSGTPPGATPAPSLEQDVHPSIPDLPSPGAGAAPDFIPPGAAEPPPPPPLDIPPPEAPGPAGGPLGNLGQVFNPGNFIQSIGRILLGAFLGIFGINPEPILGIISQLFGGVKLGGLGDPNVQKIIGAQPGRNQQFDPKQVGQLPGASGPPSGPPGAGKPSTPPGAAAPSGNIGPGGSLTLPDGSQLRIGQNPATRASSLGGASATYTPQSLTAQGIAPLFTKTNPNGAGELPPWVGQLAGAFGLTATDHPDTTLHGEKGGGSWAFDFSGPVDKEQAFANFIKTNLKGQTLQAIWQNPDSGEQLGIAGGELLGKDQYYTTKGGTYADHTDHVHWATDLAPSIEQFAPWFSGQPGAPGGVAPGGTPAAPSGFKGGPGLSAALQAKGFSPQLIRLVQGFSQVEGNNPAGNPTLGFTDGQLGGASDLQSHVDALARQFKDRQSVAGAFPEGGTDQQRAQWIAAVVGQGGLQSDWQGNSQPKDYVQRVLSAMGVQGHATGGMLNGPGTGTSDSILAKVSDGEFITKAASVQKYGPDFFHALNSGVIDPGMLQGFAAGGQPNTGDDELKKLLESVPNAGQVNGPLPSDTSAQHLNGSPDVSAQHVQGNGPLDFGSFGANAGQLTAPSPPPTPDVSGPPITDISPDPGASAPTGASDQPDPRSAPGIAPTNEQQKHTAPWLDQAVKQGIQYAGELGATAASTALGVAGAAGAGPSFGGSAGASAAAAGVGMAISQGAQVAADVASGALNVISSAGVGTLTPGTTAGAYGQPLLPQKQQQQTAGPAIVNNYNGGIHTASYDQYYQGQQRREAQQMAPLLTSMPA